MEFTVVVAVADESLSLQFKQGFQIIVWSSVRSIVDITQVSVLYNFILKFTRRYRTLFFTSTWV